MTHAGGNVEANARRHRARRAADQTASGNAGNGRKPTAQPGAKARSRKGDRWAALNTFVDVIAPRLTLVERAVWVVMFRYARGGVCETSERGMATQAGIDKASAGRALRRLEDVGLIWTVFKSHSKGASSRYGVHPRPEACLPAVIAADGARQRQADQRRQERGGHGRGRRQTAFNRVNSSPGSADQPGEMNSLTG